MSTDASAPPIISYYEQTEKSTDGGKGWVTPSWCSAASRDAQRRCSSPGVQFNSTTSQLMNDDKDKDKVCFLFLFLIDVVCESSGTAVHCIHLAQRPPEHRCFGETGNHAEVEMRRTRPPSGGRRCSLDALVKVQGSAKRWSPGLVNFIPPALAYHFCLYLLAVFTQPGDHLLAGPCKSILLLRDKICRFYHSMAQGSRVGTPVQWNYPVKHCYTPSRSPPVQEHMFGPLMAFSCVQRSPFWV